MGRQEYSELVLGQTSIFYGLDSVLEKIKINPSCVRGNCPEIKTGVEGLVQNHREICGSGSYFPQDSKKVDEVFREIYFINKVIEVANKNGYSENNLPFIEIGSEWETFRQDKEDACKQYHEFRENLLWNPNPWIRDPAPELV